MGSLEELTSHERVERVFCGETPDRVPFDNPPVSPVFRKSWAEYAGVDPHSFEDHYALDVWEVVADHSPWPGRARVLEEREGERRIINGFGQVCRERTEGFGFVQVIESAVKEKSDLSGLEFEDPLDGGRYGAMEEEFERRRNRYWVRAKVGGPYSRSKFLRGETEFLMDLAADEPFARELVNRVTDLMIEVGLESVRRLKLTTAIHVHDDFASTKAMMFSPRTFERVFLSAYARMCEAFQAAGVRVIYGGEGRTLPVLRQLGEAGVDAFCCLEPRAGVDALALYRELGEKTVFFGSMCNTVVLPRGTRDDIRAMVLAHMRLARRGRMIVGPSHSVSDEVPPENLDYLWRLVREWAPCDAPLPEE